MAQTAQAESVFKHVNGGTAEIFGREFDPTAVVAEPVPPVVTENGGIYEVKEKIAEIEREIVLGKNVHTTCLAITEPEANDDFTGDKEAYMAGVLARYRKTLMERTKHHLGINTTEETLNDAVYYFIYSLLYSWKSKVIAKDSYVYWNWICC